MKSRRAIKILIPIAALMICAIMVLLERNSIPLREMENKKDLLSMEFTSNVHEDTSCLILTDSKDAPGMESAAMMELVLDSMQVSYDVEEAAGFDYLNLLKKYDVVVVAFQDWGNIGSDFLILSNWLRAGGSLMNTITPEPDATFLVVKQRLGIQSDHVEFVGISGFKIWNQCMIGSQERSDYPFATEDGDSVVSSLNVELDEDCKIYVSSEDGTVPVLWTKKYGEGTIAVINDSILEKYQRGFYCLAYSLLEKVSIYPVMNASAYYLDDFPAPVPEGNSEYIKRDYGVDTATFYSNIWLPQILKWEEEYGILHTGLMIEEYSDQVSGDFEANSSVKQFITYGNILLNNGGELGFHGYNHMPLCLKGVDENLLYGDYKLWPSTDDMENSLRELTRFASKLFPEEDFSVYVPPSNILSPSGKQALLQACPDLKIIASTFLEDGNHVAYEQEFGVEDNGIIHTPRIVSGCEPDEYQMLLALSELNFQFVQSHFMHPDDVLDEDRGAELGWEEMSRRFEDYLNWVSQSAPDIRNVTGSGMGAAVLAYSRLSMKRMMEDDVLTVQLGGFSGEAYFLMRINEGEFKSAEGAQCKEVAENLYLIHTQKEEFRIQFGD